mmetsp:Transcript_19105/g.44266  ORF Transcript_19105/g.44266 Transcript_19105/m.44266 type:complete len:454 (+) Transcript_19105:403-1764(+)
MHSKFFPWRFCSVVISIIACRGGEIEAFSGQPQSSKNPVRVLVTGAAGKTGRIVLSKLEEDHRYEPKGLFRTERSARKILKNVDTKCPLEHVVIADITSPTFLDDLSSSSASSETSSNSNSDVSVDAGSLSNEKDSSGNGNSNNGLEKMDAMVICTSAVPRIRKRSLAAMLILAPFRAVRGKPIMNIRSMRFAWKHGGYPEKVDYLGQKAQIDLAKRLGIPHVVLVSSMGVTNPDNFINTVGKITNSKREEGHGDILLWKRRAEKYLVESGLDYTILHPGGLVDTSGGHNEFVFGVDDQLYDLNHHRSAATTASLTRISREDIAELCVAALSAGKGKKVSFDCITIPSAILSSLIQTSKGEHGGDLSLACPGIGIPVAPEKAITKSKSKLKLKTMTTKTKAATSSEATSKTAMSTTMIPTEATGNGRQKSAEEALTEFLNLSITTNYDLDNRQ